MVDSLVSSSVERLESEKLQSRNSFSFHTEWVVGAMEIPQASRWLLESKEIDGILGLGVVIRGKTTHYESICRVLDRGLVDLQKEFRKPTVFSILTVENSSQAEKRLETPRVQEGAEALIDLFNVWERSKHLKVNKSGKKNQ